MSPSSPPTPAAELLQPNPVPAEPELKADNPDVVPQHAKKLDSMMLGLEAMLSKGITNAQERLVAEVMHRYEAGLIPEEPSKPLPAFRTPEAIVFKAPISTLRDATINIAPLATPNRFRFIDCAELVHGQTLAVVEYTDLVDLPYATISYIWRGVIGPPTASMSQYGTFAVEGATEGDPISFDVLIHAATAALEDDAALLWLDRLCIMQNCQDDKRWQIKNMYSIYRLCKQCFVLPGGTRRLASLEEPTMWIHRGWTLQEAVAPLNGAKVIFAWEFDIWGGFGNPQKRLGTSGGIDLIIPKQSACIKLSALIKASVAEGVKFKLAGFPPVPVDITIRIFGNHTDAGRRHAFALAAALTLDGKDDPNNEPRATALWRSAQMRTSSRPVDMVLSIMGLFGVTLDPHAFHVNDRLGATIALAREILRNGGKPSWLAISLSLPPNRYISSFPEFPETNEAGIAVFEVNSHRVEVAELMDDVNGWLSMDKFPDGATMDESGNLHITAKAAPVICTGVRHEGYVPAVAGAYDSQLLQCHDLHFNQYIMAQDGMLWEVLPWEGSHRTPDGFVIVLGHMRTQSNSRFFDSKALVKAIMVVEYGPGKFYRVSNSWFVFNFLSYKFSGWEDRKFSIGGPEPIPVG